MSDDILINDSSEVSKPELEIGDVLKAIDDDSDSPENEEDVQEEKASESSHQDQDEDQDEEKETDDEEEVKEEKLSDEDEDLEYQDIPKRAEILKAFPELYKKFPGIERAMHREIQFTNEFATPADARNAKERLAVFNELESDVFNGNIGKLLSSVKTQDPKAFKKIGDSLLMTLNAVDPSTLHGIGETINRHVLKSAFDKSKELGGEDGEQLGLAAQILHKYLYGTPKVEGPIQQNKAEESNPEAEKLAADRKDFEVKRLSLAVNDVTTRTNSSIDKFIEKYIDPKETMSDYVRSRAIKDVKESFDKEIKEDSRFMQHLDKLWRASSAANYDDASKAAIRKAIIGKANATLMSHIKNVRATVNRATGKPSQKRESRNDSEPKNTRLTARPRTESSRTSEQTSSSKMSRSLSVNDVLKAIG